MIAIIPSIGRSPRLTTLVRTLLDDGVTVHVVDNARDKQTKAVIDMVSSGAGVFNGSDRVRVYWRPGQGIYKTWNYGLDLGASRGENVLVLNDDIVLEPGAAVAIEKILDASGFGIVSFFDSGLPNQVALRPADPSILIADTTIPASFGRAHGLCSYAFVANPKLCARADERFIWYCGDPDFFYTTAKSGARIGVAHSVTVQHFDKPGQTTGTPDEVVNEILPKGWREHDIALIHEKWGPNAGADWDPEPAKPYLFIGIPSFGGKLSAALHRWVSSIEVLSATDQFPYAVSVAILEGVSPVQYARNVLLGMARASFRTPKDRVLLIDDDMIPDETTARVLFSPADVAVPKMYRFRHNGALAMTESENRPPEIACCATMVKKNEETGEEDRFDLLFNKDATTMVKVDAAGTGCIAIKRAVVDDARLEVGPPDDDGTPAMFRMVQSASGRISEWEDVDFTLRATRLGYSVVVDTGARCGHRKAINLDAVAELVLGDKAPTRAKEEVSV